MKPDRNPFGRGVTLPKLDNDAFPISFTPFERLKLRYSLFV